MLEKSEIQSHQGICWNSLEYKVIRVYVETALTTKVTGFILEQPEIQSYQSICWNSLKC